AQAIVKGAREKQIKLFDSTSFQAIPGYGIEGVVNGKKTWVGTRRLMEEQGISINDVLPKVEALEENGKTAMLVAIDHTLAGIIAVADQVKERSKEAIAQLKQMGIKVVMITGDNQRTASAIGHQVGVDEIRAEVLPQDKAKE